MARSTSRDDLYVTKIRGNGSAASERYDSATPDWAGTNASARDLHVAELVKIFRRRRRLILTTTLCGTIAAFVLGLWIPPKYTATAQITIKPDDSVSSLVRSEAVVETHVRTLLSRDHLQRVLDDLPGDNDPGTRFSTVQQHQAGHAADGAPLRNVGSSWLPSPLELARRLGIWTGLSGSRHTNGWSLEQLKRGLRIDQEGQSRIIDVSYTSTDPETATVVANRVVELYLQGQRERARVADGIEMDRLAKRIAELKADIQRSTAGVQDLVRQGLDAANAADPGKIDQRLQQLASEAAAKGQLYQALLRRQQQIRDQGESTTSDVRILSLAAIPDRPSSASPFLYVLPALIIFLTCGTALSVILERSDRNRLRSEHDINEALGVPCSGLIPRVAEAGTDCALHDYLLANPHSAYAEALRSIAATMNLSSQRQPPRVILITSSLPGEGRTTLSASLSVCMAMLRQRVLLIDLDLDHSSAPISSADHQRPGIVDVLLNGDSTAEAIRCLPELGIDYLPMHRCSAYQQMLVAGTQMERLLHEALDDYDCVMINSPPLLGSTETRLLARLADQILFVVKWGSTTRELARNALRQLRSLDHSSRQQRRRLSALITQVDLEQHALYGFGDIGDYLLQYESRQICDRPPPIGRAPVLRAAAFNNPAFRARIAADPLRRKVVDILTAVCAQAAAAPSGLRARIVRWTAGLVRNS